MAGKKKSALEIGDLFALSDAIGSELLLYKEGDIRGKTARSLEVPELALKMNTTPTIVSSRVDWKVKGKTVIEPFITLVMEVHGNLCLLITDDRMEDRLTMRILDWSKLGTDWGKPTLMLEELKTETTRILKNIAVAQVAEFSRGRYDQIWLPGALTEAA